jgi:uncharacterized membrane protein YczE
MKNKIRPSVILWNSLVALIVVIVAVINLEAACLIIGLLSFLAFAVFAEMAFESHKENHEFIHYWIVLTPLFWILAILGSILYLGVWIKENVFDTISDKIDEKFSK